MSVKIYGPPPLDPSAKRDYGYMGSAFGKAEWQRSQSVVQHVPLWHTRGSIGNTAGDARRRMRFYQWAAFAVGYEYGWFTTGNLSYATVVAGGATVALLPEPYGQAFAVGSGLGTLSRAYAWWNALTWEDIVKIGYDETWIPNIWSNMRHFMSAMSPISLW